MVTPLHGTRTDPETVREEFRAWVEANWDPDLTLGEWWERLADAGWAAPAWPEEWHGRGLPGDAAKAVAEERQRLGVPGPPGGLGIMLAGPTIVAHGTDEQKRRYLRPILTGEQAWCQLFSEPGAGSDLAALSTRAVRDGEEWVISGQKVWSSGAHLADLGMLLARTDPDAPKHNGITYFVLEMDQPGIEVRPIREMTGRALFNEVFLDGARVPVGNDLGGVNGGWAVALTTLANERSGLGGSSDAAGGLAAGTKAGNRSRRAGDFAGRRSTRSGTGAAFAGGSSRLLIETARSLGRSADPAVRQGIARLYTLEQISRYTAMRAKAAVASGRRPGAEVSTQKLNMSRIVRCSRDVGMAILGAHGMHTGAGSATKGVIQEMFLFSPAPSIYGGTDEIQRNIIGERVLGLPREPRDDRDVPFRELLVGTQQSPVT